MDRSLGGYSTGNLAKHKRSILLLLRSQLRSGAQGERRRSCLAQNPLPAAATLPSGFGGAWKQHPRHKKGVSWGMPASVAMARFLLLSSRKENIRKCPSRAPVVSFAGNLRKTQGKFGWASFLHQVSFLAFPRVGFKCVLQIQLLSKRLPRGRVFPVGGRPRQPQSASAQHHRAPCANSRVSGAAGIARASPALPHSAIYLSLTP